MKITYLLITIFIFTAAVKPQAKFEPADGSYVGAFIVNDNNVNGNVDLFESLTGKKHSTYFSYTGWNQPFPMEWVKYYDEKDVVVQVAFEPNGGLHEVVDGPYIREWARQANKSGAMILLRWASEMNGSWVAWYGNPVLYIQKWRLIYNIMKEEAPNVAMVWAPNDIPNNPQSPANYVHSYYPGDEYVDWVGIDFYGVYYYENGTPERTDPRQKLKVVYDTYADRKPIIICEWAATHYTTRVNPPEWTIDYAIAQMDSLYRNVEVQFPRLKAINWFSMNTLLVNGCNYSLTDNQQVLNNYKLIMQQENHFRSTTFRNVPRVTITNIQGDTVLTNNISANVDVLCDVQIDSVVLYIGETRIDKRTLPPYHFNALITSIEDGIYDLKAIAYANSGYYNFDKIKIIVDKAGQYSQHIIDVTKTGFTRFGGWNSSTSQSDKYGPYYFYSFMGDGSNKAFWTPVLQQEGYYDIYAWWSQHPNRASNTPYVIHHRYATDTIRVNQKIDGGRWNYLGKFFFNQGNEHNVEINNDADGIVIADAVRFEWSFLTDINEQNDYIPSEFILYQNYPNPFNPVTKIKFTIPQMHNPLLGGARGGLVTLKVYNILGNEVATLVNESKEPGIYEAEFDASKLSSGVYFYTLRATPTGRQAGEFNSSKKMMLLK